MDLVGKNGKSAGVSRPNSKAMAVNILFSGSVAVTFTRREHVWFST